MRKKTALITGITGQDGSYLAELLLSKNYNVHGLVRRVSVEKEAERFSRINHILDDLEIHIGDIRDYPTLWRLIAQIKPDEVYHLAAQSFVYASFQEHLNTYRTNENGTRFLLSVIKETSPLTRFYFAGTSEMFGDALTSPQNEKSPFNPVSPYGFSKLAGFYETRLYRTAYNVFACTGILFNHESPRRGHEFVTRKISMAAAGVRAGVVKNFTLGNLDALRDWGYAMDYVAAMRLMLQQDNPKDYVIATGETHSVREFAEEAFDYVGLDYKKYLKTDKKFCRPAEVNKLCGDPFLARKELGWKPKMTFKELVRTMVDSDLNMYSKKSLS